MNKIKQIEKHKQTMQPTKSETNEMARLIKVVILITVIFLVFYLLTLWITGKSKNEPTNDNKTETIQYDEIMLGTLLTQNNSEYYVLVYTGKDPYLSMLLNYVSIYDKLEKHTRFYSANLNTPFNESYLGDKTNTNITKITELKLKGTTLLKVKDKKIVETYDTLEKITNKLQELVKVEDKK